MTGGLDEEQAAVNASILDVTLSLSGELFSQVRRMLVLDIFNNGVPAAVIIHQITVSGGVNNVEPQSDTVLLNDVGDALDLGGRSNGFIGLQTTLGVDEVGSENGVDQG